MKTIIQIIVLIVSINVYSQLDANSVMGIPIADNISQMQGVIPTEDGALVFNREDEKLYLFINNGSATTNWRKIYLAPKIIEVSGTYELEPTDDGNIIVFNDATDPTLDNRIGRLNGTEELNSNIEDTIFLNSTNFPMGIFGIIRDDTGASSARNSNNRFTEIIMYNIGKDDLFVETIEQNQMNFWGDY